MRFTTILSIALSIGFAYGQYSEAAAGLDNGGIISDVENNQVPDTSFTDAANITTPPAASAAAANGDASDDYGDAASINQLDNGEASENDAAPASAPADPVSPVPAAPAAPAVNDSAAAAGTISGESTVPPQNNESNANSNSPTQVVPVNTGASGEAAPIASQEAATQTPNPMIALDDTSKTNTSIDPATIASGLVGAAAVSSAGIFFMVKRSKRRGLESVRSQISMA